MINDKISGLLRPVGVRFDSQSRRFITGHPDGKTLSVWDAEEGRRVGDFRTNEFVGLGGEFVGENTFVSWELEGSVRVWNLERQVTPRRLRLRSSEKDGDS